jgi:hypothetical protein
VSWALIPTIGASTPDKFPQVILFAVEGVDGVEVPFSGQPHHRSFAVANSGLEEELAVLVALVLGVEIWVAHGFALVYHQRIALTSSVDASTIAQTQNAHTRRRTLGYLSSISIICRTSFVTLNFILV